MITMLRLANFRRHEDLELRFDDAGQIVLVAGRNGVGKTSLLEAITYALYAEGRHGRRNLDQLLRRGAELEGMEVEMTFTVGEDRYRVLRRRDGRSSTAVLYSNDHPLVEGQREVTEEITRVLGMDVAGFRLATIAQQKDLDGLASLTAATRTRMVGRLLRLDALTRARDAASELHHNEARVAAQLRPLQPLEQFENESLEAVALLATTQAELDRTTAAVTELRNQLDAHVPFLAEWQELHDRLTRANAELAIAEADRQRISVDLESISVPAEPTEQLEDLSELSTQVAATERHIAEAESARVNVQHRHSVTAELELVSTRLIELGDSSISDSRRAELSAAQDLHEQAVASVAALTAEITELEELDRAENLIEHDFTSRLQRAAALGADCDSCGQSVSADHRHRQVDELRNRLEVLQTGAAPRRDRIRMLRQDSVRLEEQLASSVRAVAESVAALEQTGRDDAERKDLLRRRDTYLDQLSRLPLEVADLDVLYARKAELALRVARTQAAMESERQRSATMVRRAQTEAALLAADNRLSVAAAAVEANSPSPKILQAHAAHESARQRLQAEEQVLAFNSTEVAVARERHNAAEAALERARAEDDRRRRHQTVALHAGNAKRLLSDVADRLSTTVRPALEGAIANLLATMSEGRFTQVSVSQDYEIRVEDDGKLRPLSELSGGEADLVALATRLALAQIVSERHGSGGAGFLILDEPLGSQDPLRRRSILAGLRALRGTYDQIFLISHIDGIEDAADTVVNISASDDRNETVVDVT
jgi:exonuclease SbcC